MFQFELVEGIVYVIKLFGRTIIQEPLVTLKLSMEYGESDVYVLTCI